MNELVRVLSTVNVLKTLEATVVSFRHKEHSKMESYAQT